MTRSLILTSVLGGLLCWAPPVAAEDALPFQHKVEVYRNKEGDVAVFTVRLEQPFLADEFEKSSFLRLRSADERAYLIYPKETTFQQKHAEFYGRLRGEGTVKLQLSYEIISENLDGTRRVEVRQGEVEVPIPPPPDPPAAVGASSIFQDWARQQNQYFLELLRYYPEETFFQYCILQSRARYGVTPPPIAKLTPDRTALETDLYQMVTGSMAIQDTMQRAALAGGGRAGDLNIHVSTLKPPALRSLPYKDLLEKRRAEDHVEPKPHDIARLVPEDQYFLHFRSMESMGELLDLAQQWGDNLLRLFTVRAQDQRLQAKLEEQLCVRRTFLAKLFADKVIDEVAVTGADPFLHEGTDVTMIFRLAQPEVFRKAAAGWLAETRAAHPDLVSREFNYRGHKVSVHYTRDRVVSSFVVEHDDCIVFSNSHRAVRQVIDAALGKIPSLHEALDYRYVTTILPPADSPEAGYFFVSEAFIKRLVGPEAKISEKRRLECFNNLVMLNNASLFYRLEYGRSPESLSDLVEGRFVDLGRVVCPHGGAYAFDAANDTCACSLHNRLKYLTPNVELAVQNVSQQEAAEYERYKTRYAAFWQEAFDPIAVRVSVGPRLKLETCVLPFANGSFYERLRRGLDEKPRAIGTARFAPSAVASVVAVPGRRSVGEYLRALPGVAEALRADPTLTDMKWLGDRVGVHFCDGQTILQIDPTRLSPTQLPMLGEIPLPVQAAAGAVLMSTELPAYVTVDVDNPASAARLLELLSRQAFLRRGTVLPGLQGEMDAYRLPDYKEHLIYVFTGQVYAVKLRLHAAVVEGQLVVATRPETLREVIDVGAAKDAQPPAAAHVLVRLNRRALDRMRDDIELYWAEKSRVACHRNIISIHNLCRLYDTPIDKLARLSEAKYGVRYFCPDHGEYAFDAERNQVYCTVHGNREASRQNPRLDKKSAFAEFTESLDEIVASLRFEDDALITTVEIQRSEEKK
ncbi:MAG: hypothetical protein JW809_08220 [Pirellulales bacterium]|nr:hypothetical protein [Pirellulales bacterium]